VIYSFAPPSNTRLERTRHERACLLGCVGEPLKRNVGLLLVFKMESSISFVGTRLNVGNISWEVAHPILQAFMIEKKVIVLYDPDSYRESFGQFPNLVAFSLDGQRIWTAELPTHESGDCYYRAYLNDGLMADSWKSFSCKLDEFSGKIVSKTFYK
jgi:hypothetical protein